jgi:hypothetical protein
MFSTQRGCSNGLFSKDFLLFLGELMNGGELNWHFISFFSIWLAFEFSQP